METNLTQNLSQKLSNADQFVTQYLLPFGWKILGAFVAWFVGNLLIRGVQKLARAGLLRKHIDSTLINYANSIIGFGLRAVLLITILGIFGIETTSFSAILAAAGVAIGIAWSGLLSNFAAGVFLIIFRPFHVGDNINAAGVTGTVKEIGMFLTTINTDAKVKIFVGNNKIFSDNILNFSANKTRVVAFKVQVAHSVNPMTAIDLLKQNLAATLNIIPTEAITGEITELNNMGSSITMKVVCLSPDFNQVTASGYQIIHQTLTAAAYPIPELRINSIK